MRERFPFSEFIECGEKSAHYKDVVESFSSEVTRERVQRIDKVIEHRSFEIVTVLEGLYDRGNISAVMRSCEAMGFMGLHIVELSEKFKESQRVTKGADKWLEVTKWNQTPACLEKLKSQGYRVLATHFEEARPIYDFDFTQPTAIVFGNERDGVSPDVLDLCDDRMVIPMVGFVQSFNISVAAAISLHYIYNERRRAMGSSGSLSPMEQEILKAEYLKRAHVSPEKIFQNL